MFRLLKAFSALRLERRRRARAEDEDGIHLEETDHLSKNTDTIIYTL